VLAKTFDISPGTAAQTITALAVGRFARMPVSGMLLDRLGTRAALTAGPAIALLGGALRWVHALVQFHLGFSLFARHW
jgi:hypothetical protein